MARHEEDMGPMGQQLVSLLTPKVREAIADFPALTPRERAAIAREVAARLVQYAEDEEAR